MSPSPSSSISCCAAACSCGSSGTGATNPYGFSGIAGLCGLFSKQATDKLREICDTLLSTTGDGDRDRRDGLAAARNGDPGTS